MSLPLQSISAYMPYAPSVPESEKSSIKHIWALVVMHMLNAKMLNMNNVLMFIGFVGIAKIMVFTKTAIPMPASDAQVCGDTPTMIAPPSSAFRSATRSC